MSERSRQAVDAMRRISILANEAADDVEITLYNDDIGVGKVPKYMTKEAACADVFAANTYVIKPREAVKVDLGFSLRIPSGYCIKITPRSSQLVKYKLVSPLGVIDSDYTGRISYPVYNGGSEEVTICKGERVGQIEFCKLEARPSVFETCDEERNPEGFGTTGRM